MKTPIKKSRYVLAKVHSQLNGFAAQPELAEGMPFPAAALKAKMDEYVAAKQRQESGKKSAELLTGLVHAALFEMYDAFRRNVSAAELRHGHYAPELAYIGGRPLKAGPAGEIAPTK